MQNDSERIIKLNIAMHAWLGINNVKIIFFFILGVASDRGHFISDRNFGNTDPPESATSKICKNKQDLW